SCSIRDLISPPRRRHSRAVFVIRQPRGDLRSLVRLIIASNIPWIASRGSPCARSKSGVQTAAIDTGCIKQILNRCSLITALPEDAHCALQHGGLVEPFYTGHGF